MNYWDVIKWNQWNLWIIYPTTPWINCSFALRERETQHAAGLTSYNESYRSPAVKGLHQITQHFSSRTDVQKYFGYRLGEPHPYGKESIYLLQVLTNILSAKVASIDRRMNSGVSKVLPVRNTTLLGSTRDQKHGAKRRAVIKQSFENVSQFK
jgi:hypothetical protein